MSWSLHEKIAYTCNILAMEGQNDLNLGHVSARSTEREDAYWIKGYGLGLEEITAEDIILMDLDGNKLQGELRPHREVPIHAEIYRARPDVNSVVHTHPPVSTAFSACDTIFVPISHEGAVFAEGIPVFSETTNLITNGAQGKVLADVLGDASVVLMRNHGITTVGSSVEEACLMALFLEKALKLQLLAELFGGAQPTNLEELRAKKGNLAHLKNAEKTWEYMVRKLQRREVSPGAILI